MLLFHTVAFFATPPQNVLEFLNTCTRPVDRNGYGLSPQDSDQRARFFEQKLRLLPDNLAIHEEWRRLLVTYSVSGVQVHDARLVAAMRVHGIKHILTFNDRDFTRYADIQAVRPRTVSSIDLYEFEIRLSPPLAPCSGFLPSRPARRPSAVHDAWRVTRLNRSTKLQGKIRRELPSYI